ncbi:hypothetical protein H310_02493 [Aphanomyces invadans]|uniref:HSF-type DNA-binding domain-containing protein n=1 Tax=Aphanomyces invadans TaxID=157072 RepID=A0A024UNX8_9STRA|nr:hypothetical protein H310_02493 [Aphanomyces invadans]ETW08156.1 hypothetical protein H310_02493 [Aphanomyces invadans]|eukprot:XP_008864249.1 hypothetical protein H310_02493 [Aphanomyces invadans]
MKPSMKSKVEAAPLFLQKIYAMFEDSPVRIAGWMNKGTTVVIKEPEEFAKAILPQYFKHSNFSSFVRQLNFYGFRKFKKDDILIEAHDPTKNWWEFRHEKFVRHMPELMAQIRRKTYSDASVSSSNGTVSEVDVLKSQVKTMQTQFDALTSQIASLTEVVAKLAQSKKRSLSACDEDMVEQVVSDEKRVKVEDGLMKDELPEAIAAPTLSKQHSLMFDQLDDLSFDDSMTLDPAAWLDGVDFSIPIASSAAAPATVPPMAQRCSNTGPLTFLIALKPQQT